MIIHGAGSVHPMESKPRTRCRVWRLYVSTDAGQKTRIFHGTWTAAKAALIEFKAELAATPTDSTGFAAYALRWLEWRAQSGEYAPGTIANNRREINALNRSALARVELAAITPETCRDALLWIKSNPQRGDNPLTNTTMNKIYQTLHAILEQATDDGRIPANPMRKIRAPKPDTKERVALTPEQLHRLIETLSNRPLDGRVVSLLLMAYCGLRRAETCALAPTDVRDGLIHVDKAIKERDGSIGAPKSTASIRAIPAPPQLLDILNKWNKQRDALGFSTALTLCCNTVGGVLLPQNLYRWWVGDSKHNGIRETLGYPALDLHGIRHSNLSMMARHMSAFELQHYAGWSSIEPARVYIHRDMDALTRAVNSAWK